MKHTNTLATSFSPLVTSNMVTGMNRDTKRSASLKARLVSGTAAIALVALTSVAAPEALAAGKSAKQKGSKP
jgi:hypothetical protein